MWTRGSRSASPARVEASGVKSITVNTPGLSRSPMSEHQEQKRKFKFQPKVKTSGSRPSCGRRRQRHMRPKR